MGRQEFLKAQSCFLIDPIPDSTIPNFPTAGPDVPKEAETVDTDAGMDEK